MAIPWLSHGYPMAIPRMSQRLPESRFLGVDAPRWCKVSERLQGGWNGADLVQIEGGCNFFGDMVNGMRYLCACSYLLGAPN